MKSMVLVLVSCLVVSAIDADLYENVALNKPAYQSSVASGIPHATASKANDGDHTNVENMSENSCIHTAYSNDQQNKEAWWRVDLEFITRIHEVLITYRNWDRSWEGLGSGAGRLAGFSIFVSNSSDFKGKKCFQQSGNTPNVQRTPYLCSAIGRFITVYNNRTHTPFPNGYSNEAVLELCEVEIPGCPFQHFGQGCTNSCFCKEVTCDYKTGQCNGTCQHGYVSESCNIPCNSGYYGENCSLPCPHCGGSGTCNQMGECISGCKEGFYSDKSPGCSQQCGHCMDTNCNQDGSCPLGCSDGYYMSHCKATCPDNCNNRICDQKSGKCTSCAVGYYLSDCTAKCSNNCKTEECEQESGDCLSCLDGYFGKQCIKECPQNCALRKCDYDLGKCIACDPAFYGFNCTKECLHCGGDRRCNDSGFCLNGCETGYVSDILPGCRQKCENCQQEMTSHSTVAMAVGSASGGFVIVLVIIIVVVNFYRRKRGNSPKKREHVHLHSTEGQSTEHIYTNTQPGSQIAQGSSNDESVTFHQRATSKYHAKYKKETTPKFITKPQQTTSEDAVYNNTSEDTNSIRTDAFQNYATLKQKEKQLETEYQSIPYGAQYPHVEAEKPENMYKNRFKKTFAYDHSRVILSSQQGRKSDYINANYIDGYKDKKQYIATQGPITKTIGDFWRMTWENKVGKIVMVTNLKELNKVKCEQYWPDPNKPIRHDGFEITCLDEREFSYYAVRNLRMENKKTKEQRKVWQFHFTTWPDHGTPDPLLLVLFHRRVMNTKAKLNGPMIVHCSAGIGRTGTFIGLDALFKQGQDTGRVDVKRYVEIMRKDRMNMVQTAQQYECLHEALAESLQTQDTVIMMNEFTTEWRKSQSDTGPRNQRKFRKEYDILVSLKKTDNQEDYKTAMLTVNKMKNRNPAVKASDKYRPFLNSYGGERTDYINAVILPTHTKQNGYIVTQRPLSNTVLDFWQMVEEHEISKIVLFESESDETTMFYPGARDMDIDNGVLQYRKETDYSDDVTMIELVIVYNDVAEDRKVTIIKVHTCEGQLPNAQQILKVNEIVASLDKSEEPCCIISQDGISPCDIYCTVTNIQESMKIDNEIDVFQTARQLQLRRPEFFGKYESYELCLRIINEHLTYDSVYFNS